LLTVEFGESNIEFLKHWAI